MVNFFKSRTIQKIYNIISWIDRKIKSNIKEDTPLMTNKMISINEEIDVFNSPISSECEKEDEYADSISLESEEFFDAKCMPYKWFWTLLIEFIF